MKKQLLWGMLLLMAGFSSCQKDSFKPVEQTSVGSKDKLRVAATNPGTYNELTLLARQPGENFDTYIGNWGGVSIKMQATPTWDHDKYPNLVDGVPCTGGGYSVGDQNQITTSNAGGQDIFIVGVATASFTARQLFTNDVTTYINALDNYISSHQPSSAIPQASSYIKTTYGDGSSNPSFVQVTGKLIGTTSGSHFAFAPISYPTPAPATGPGTLQVITFDKDGYEYSVLYSGTTITSGYNVTLLAPPHTHLETASASGSLTVVDSQTCNINVTINLVNGNTITYQGLATFGL